MEDQAKKAAELKVDQRIAAEADQLVMALVEKYPELRGVVFVLDWNYPKAVADGMAAGAWRVRGGDITLEKCYGMQLQLARFMNHMGRAITKIGEETLKNVQAMQQSTLTSPAAVLPSGGLMPPRASPQAPGGPAQPPMVMRPMVAPPQRGMSQVPMPAMPAVPPEPPAIPPAPVMPEPPSIPSAPAMPEPPSIPSAPAMPEPPSIPSAPAMPEPPQIPSVPVGPAGKL